MLDKETLISLYQDLVEITKATGVQNDMEIDFLKKVGAMMGLSDEDMLMAESTPNEYRYPANEMERITQFQRMILVMHVDFHAAPEEMELIRQLGFKLGFNSETVNRVLIKMQEHERGMIPPEELITLFKINHN